jgi:hypothetical protein
MVEPSSFLPVALEEGAVRMQMGEILDRRHL